MSSFLRCYRVELHKLLRSPFSWLIFAVSLAAPMGNFIFAAHKSCPGRELFNALREKRIFVRYFDKPRISNYLRITVGTPEEMKALVDFLKNYLRQE